jgi:hypothetical protein
VQRATEYKENLLNALTKSDSPSKLNRILSGSGAPLSEQRLNKVL